MLEWTNPATAALNEIRTAPLVRFSVLALNSIFFLVDPFAAIPSFLAITQSVDPARRKRMCSELKEGMRRPCCWPVLSESGDVFAKPLACNIEELVATVGSRGPQVERDLEALCGFQLIDRRAANASALRTSNESYITPTRLGLQLFALCNGHRGALRDFYFSDSSKSVVIGK